MVTRKIKVISSAVLILTLLISFSPFTILASNQPTVELTIDKASLEKNDLFILEVNLKDFNVPYNNIGSFQVDLNFDSTFLQPQQNEVTFGEIYNQWNSKEYYIGMNKVENGLIQFATSNFSDTNPFNGNGVLYTIPFKVLKDGKTIIEIKKSIFIQKDKPGIEVPHTVNSIEINIPAKDSSIPSIPVEDGQGPSLELEEIEKFSRVNPKDLEEYKDYDEILKLNWAASSIKRLSELGIFTGGLDGNFRPKDSITRAEFAIVLARALELAKATTSNTTGQLPDFNDVEKDEWFYEGVNAVVSHQLMIGKDNNGQIHFSPRQNITRGEIATILVRALHLVGKYDLEKLQVPFKDIPNDWSKEGIIMAYQEGLIKGKADDRFEPLASATRAEVAVMITRLIDYTPINR